MPRVQAKRYAVASASNFANANNNGNANNNSASNADGGVRPLLVGGHEAIRRAAIAGNELASFPSWVNEVHTERNALAHGYLRTMHQT